MNPSSEAQRSEAELETLISARSEEELFLLAANAMASFIDAEQAVLWVRSAFGRPHVAAISGLSSVDRHIDFTHWFEAAAKIYLTTESPIVSPVPEHFENPRLQSERPLYLLEDALHAKIMSSQNEIIGGMFVSRSSPFTDWEISRLALYTEWLGKIHQRWYEKKARTIIWKILARRKSLYLLFAVSVLGVCLIPIRMSATASVEITPREATPISATQDGVIERILVRPNQVVTAGTSLVRYDDAVVKNRLAVARQNISIAQADLDRTAGKAFGDEAARAELRTLHAKVAEKAAESRYLEELARRLEIRASSEGVAIFASTEEWVGRPVQSGERIMLLANPSKIWITLYLPPDEMIPLDKEASVRVHLDIDPLSSLTATVRESSYEAVLTSEGQLAYLLRASLDEGQDIPRIGLKGVARIQGSYHTIAYVILRKPLKALRRFIGW